MRPSPHGGAADAVAGFALTVTAVLLAIALLWLGSVGVWPLLAALLVSSTVWADGGTATEVIAAGSLAWGGVALVRRWLRARRRR